jgi:ribosome biogenesis GTPase
LDSQPLAQQRSELALVLEASRRHVTILSPDGEVLTGTISSKAIEVATGDAVKFEVRNGKIFVTEVAPSSRCLFRSYRGAVKRMGANIDHLFIISALGETLKPLVIDRMLIAARIESIPTSLIINKADLGLQQAEIVTNVYQEIGVRVIPCGAKAGQGLEPLREILDSKEVRIGALCGVSGVGKSTILNRLVPDAKARTAEISARTGQGKQTTSQPRGFIYEGASTARKVLIDFPGVQFFGLSHVDPAALCAAIDEFRDLSLQCRFINCRHLQEPECAVREAVERGIIAAWRYQSYLQILDEIEEIAPY